MLLDTSGFLCLLDSREKFHREALQAYANARQWLTHSYVLDEFVALAQARRFNRIKALEYLQDLLTDRMSKSSGSNNPFMSEHWSCCSTGSTSPIPTATRSALC